MSIFVYMFGWAPAGLLAGWVAARMAKSIPIVSRWWIGAPLVLSLTFALTASFDFLTNAIDWRGACAEWDERGSHLCTRFEYAFLDYELTVVFAAAASLPGSLIGLASRSFFAR